MKWTAVFILLCLANALAFEGFISSNEYVEIYNETYFFSADRENQLFIQLPTNSSIILKNGSCEIKDFTRICYKYYKMESHDAIDDRTYYRYKIKVERLDPYINIKRDIDSTNLFVGEKTRITVEIRNDGRQESTIRYIDDIDYIIDTYKSETKDGFLVYEKFINVGDKYFFYYYIKPKKAGTYVSKPKITYTDVNKIKELIVKPIEIKVLEPPVKINIATPEKNKIGKIINVNISLDKDIVSEIFINHFEIYVPKEIILLNYSNLSYSGSLRNKINFPLTIKSNEVGNFTFNFILEYFLKGTTNEIKQDYTITVPVPDIDVNFYILDKYYEKEIIDIGISIEKDEMIKDLKIKVMLEDINKTYYTKNILLKNFIIPKKDNMFIKVEINFRVGTKFFTKRYSKIVDIIEISKYNQKNESMFWLYILIILIIILILYLGVKRFK